jgi:hypothetical protein
MGKANMRQEYGPGLAYSPDALKSLQELFDRAWQNYVSVGLIEETSSMANELREDLARLILRAEAEGVPLPQIEKRVMQGVCHRLYAAALAL